MHRTKFWLLIILCGLSGRALAQRLATLQVVLPAATHRQSIPVSTDLDALTAQPSASLGLVQVAGKKRTVVPCQVENGNPRMLHWLVETGPGPAGRRTYELVRQAQAPPAATITTTDAGGALLVRAGRQNLLQYVYKTVYPPAGVDTAFRRSGFMHPLWAPHGQVLTRIQAPDHYHHYGIWNPWTHVLFEGDTVDFWNLKKRQGTVRFVKVASTTDGPVYGEYQVAQEHVAFQRGGAQKTALRELQRVRVYQPATANYYLVDVAIEMSCATASPVRLLTYRYGGFSWRATEQWTKDNSEVLTSAGNTRPTADGSLARWCLVQGQLGAQDYGGMVLMSHPANYNHPEPLRIWPETQNGRGDMFVNFSPTKNQDWLLQPGPTYTLQYRLLVYNGRCPRESAESNWQAFSAPPRVLVVRK